jgi:hypothetical protein
MVIPLVLELEVLQTPHQTQVLQLIKLMVLAEAVHHMVMSIMVEAVVVLVVLVLPVVLVLVLVVLEYKFPSLICTALMLQIVSLEAPVEDIMVPVVVVVVMDLELLVPVVLLVVVVLVQTQQQDGQVLDHLQPGVLHNIVVEVDIMEPVVAVVVDLIIKLMVLVVMEEMVSSVLDTSISLIDRHSINCPQPLQETPGGVYTMCIQDRRNHRIPCPSRGT